MKRLIYTIWDKEKQEVVDLEIHDNIFIAHDGKIGYIDTVGRFHENDNLCINDIIVK